MDGTAPIAGCAQSLVEWDCRDTSSDRQAPHTTLPRQLIGRPAGWRELRHFDGRLTPLSRPGGPARTATQHGIASLCC